MPSEPPFSEISANDRWATRLTASSGKHAAQQPSLFRNTTVLSGHLVSSFPGFFLPLITGVWFIPTSFYVLGSTWVCWVKTSNPVSFPQSFFGLLFHHSCPLLILSFPLNSHPYLSLCHFNLHSLSVCACQFFPSSPLLLSSWLCFSAEVSVDSSHIFPQLFALLPLSLSLPHSVPSPVSVHGPNQTTRHSQNSVHKDTAHSFFNHYRYGGSIPVFSGQ